MQPVETGERVRSDALVSFLERLLKIGFGLGGLISLASGVWMWIAPDHWFKVFPGGVADFGPQNDHFIRDLGGWYIAGGILLLFALTNTGRFGGVALVVTLVAAFSHSLSHIRDVASGDVGAEHWITDLPFVHAPLLLLGIMLWIWWTLKSERRPVKAGPPEVIEPEPTKPS
jgi:hypothetical protein